MYQSLLVDNEDEIDKDFDCDCFDNMMDVKYEKANPATVAQAQSHLLSEQQNNLAKRLVKYDKLFDGTLGRYPHCKLHLTLQADAQPVHRKDFPVAHAHQEVFKKEFTHLVEIGVLERCIATEWVLPTFIVPKKDGRVRWVSEFRLLNAVLKRKE
jgi:hypothetical protein